MVAESLAGDQDARGQDAVKGDLAPRCDDFRRAEDGFVEINRGFHVWIKAAITLAVKHEHFYPVHY